MASMARDRFTLVEGNPQDRRATFARDVRKGLASHPKRLPCWYFYDQRGSELFEAICRLPEYYVARAEHEILRERAADITSQCAGAVTLVELGSGSAEKTRIIIEFLLKRQPGLRYVPIDICREALETSSLKLLEEYPGLEIAAVAAEYQEGLRQLQLQAPCAKLILWLGSNVGNVHRHEAAALLRQLRETMASGDRLLVGIDLRKDAAVLERAYDDAQGLTAQFNLNLLARINRELDGRFELTAFQHRAVYDEETGYVQLYLVSRRAQRVRIDGLGLEVDFATGETVHTEDSVKYSRAEIEALARAGGFRVERQWLDGGERFTANLLAPVPG